MDLFFGICLGIGLAAACGFRVFVPMFVMSLAAKTGHLSLADGFDWIGSWPAVAAFGTATALESAAYYVPWLDNLLDTIASPAAVAAGAIATAACVADADPLVQWSAALIAGVGVAGTVQTTSVTARAASSLTTGGLGNFAVATIELVGSVVMSTLALLLPVLAAVAAVGLVATAITWVVRRRRRAVAGRGPV